MARPFAAAEVADDTDPTQVRHVLLNEYSGALRGMRNGQFRVAVPPARDGALQGLGIEIAELASRLEQTFDRISRLNRISLDIGAGVFLDDILDRVYESFRGVIPYDRIGCALLDRDTMQLRARWARTESTHARIGHGYSQDLAGSSLQTILDTGQPRILNDLEAYLLANPGSQATRLIVEEGMRSSLTCPLIARGVPVGFIFFSSMRTGTYRDQHQDIFMQLAGQLAIVVEKSLLYEQLYHLNVQLIESQRRLEHAATHDALTGLPNRRAMLDALDKELARASRSHVSFGALMLDVDHFKSINDRHGHAGGDAVLRGISSRLADCMREGEVVGRIGGEEFLALLATPDAEALEMAAERLRSSVESLSITWHGHTVPVTVSIGAALSPDDGSLGSDLLIACADEALYAAKAAGRNCVRRSS